MPQSLELSLLEKVEEDRVWRDFARPVLVDLPKNALEICHHGFTEILNNAVDHSEGTRAIVEVSPSATSVEIVVTDNGVGIFRKVQRAFALVDPRDAVLEIVKGKLTTDPRSHTGEGIFFVSRMFDSFSILSGSLFFRHSGEIDWLLEQAEDSPGTLVSMQLNPGTARTTKEVFDRFTSEVHGSYSFDVTHVPVALARYGDENLVSRSQAKRVLSRFERFRRVILDFAEVQSIGQAFADEVFRVFRTEHPEIELIPVHTCPDVQRMIARSQPHSD